MMKLVHKALSCESMLRPAVENSGSNVISRRNHDFDEDTCEPMPIVDVVDDDDDNDEDDGDDGEDGGDDDDNERHRGREES